MVLANVSLVPRVRRALGLAHRGFASSSRTHTVCYSTFQMRTLRLSDMLEVTWLGTEKRKRMQGWRRVSFLKTQKVRLKHVDSGPEEGQVDRPGESAAPVGALPGSGRAHP